MRRPPLVALIVLLALPMAAHGGLSCLLACNPHQQGNDCCQVNPDFGVACGTYTALRAQAQQDLSRERFETCISSSLACQPTTAGRCTIILDCVRNCREKFAPHVPEAQIQREAFGEDSFLCDGRPLKAQGRKTAARACRRCASVVTTITTSSSSSSSISTSSSSTTSTTSTTVLGQVTTTVATTSTTTEGPPTTSAPPADFIHDSCFNPCLMRLDSVKSCYERCEDACEGDRTALPICQRSCRNAFCLAIKAKCTLNQRNQDKIDPAYSGCCCDAEDPNDPDCNSDRPDCRTADEAECETTTTTTSTTSSTTTSAPRLTTTTTSPQI